jgi:hypothetical protein
LIGPYPHGENESNSTPKQLKMLDFEKYFGINHCIFSLILGMKIFCLCVLVVLFYSAIATDDEQEGAGLAILNEVEKKQAAQLFKLGFKAGKQIGEAISRLVSDLKKGNKIKSDFTKKFVDEAMKRYPGWSVAIVHKAKTTGKAIHQHVEVPLPIGTYGYEVYFAKPGTRFDIWRHGDGGFINWSFGGAWKRKDNHIWIE